MADDSRSVIVSMRLPALRETSQTNRKTNSFTEVAIQAGLPPFMRGLSFTDRRHGPAKTKKGSSPLNKPKQQNIQKISLHGTIYRQIILFRSNLHLVEDLSDFPFVQDSGFMTTTLLLSSVLDLRHTGGGRFDSAISQVYCCPVILMDFQLR